MTSTMLVSTFRNAAMRCISRKRRFGLGGEKGGRLFMHTD